METITKTYQVYNYSELSETAKERAYADWLRDRYYTFGDDNRKTLDEFCLYFGISVRNWYYDENGYSYKFGWEVDKTQNHTLTGLRLWKYLVNRNYDYFISDIMPKYYECGSARHWSQLVYEPANIDCQFTGYWTDEIILAPFKKFMRLPQKGVTFDDLVDECLDSFFQACQRDYAYEMGIERFEEDCEGFAFRFLENGERF